MSLPSTRHGTRVASKPGVAVGTRKAVTPLCPAAGSVLA